jgi:hypothetical protein
MKIIGHGLEKDGMFFCCAHCAEEKGVKGLRDRIWQRGRERQIMLRVISSRPRSSRARTGGPELSTSDGRQGMDEVAAKEDADGVISSVAVRPNTASDAPGLLPRDIAAS